MLQCFAYWKEIAGREYRHGTILVSGGDETPVGIAVLKNPGSAAPLGGSLFPREDGREEFSVDATMRCLAELFHLDTRVGTVLLFNLSDFRSVEPDFKEEAPVFFDDVEGEILSHPSLPVYIGWGDFYKRPEYRRRAEEIFTAACNEANPYLCPVMDANLFLHPLYLLRYGRTEPCCVELLREFNRLKPILPERKRRSRKLA